MPRLALVLSLLLLAALPAAADAKVRKGPSGAAFYTPPQRAGRRLARLADLGAQADGQGGTEGRRRQPPAALPLEGREWEEHGGVRDAGDPEGARAEGRLAADLVGARDDRHRRRVRAVAQRRLGPGAARALAQGRLRGRPHRLRGPRDAGRAPVPDRALGGLLGARRGARRAQARQAHRQAIRDRRPLAGRAVRAVGGVDGAELHERSEAPRHRRVRAGVAPRRAVDGASEPHVTERADRPRRADPARHRHRAAGPRRARRAQRRRRAAVPAHADRVHRPADRHRFVRRARAVKPPAPGHRHRAGDRGAGAARRP